MRLLLQWMAIARRGIKSTLANKRLFKIGMTFLLLFLSLVDNLTEAV